MTESFRRKVWRSASAMLAMAAVVGVVAGLGAIIFEFLSQLVFHYVLGEVAGYAPHGPAGEHLLFEHSAPAQISILALLLLPGLGGLVSGWICTTFAPEARGHGTDAAIEAYHRKGGRVRARVPGIKTLATVISLGTGGSGGREGPIAQIGAGFGSWFATTMGLTARQRRILLAAGMGAGIGAIFRAPLAGAIFASEVMYRDADLEPDCLLPSFVASAVAYCVFCGWLGEWSHLLAITDPPAFRNIFEILPYTLLALALVPVIIIYVKTFYGIDHFVERLPGPPPLYSALGGLLTGAVGIVLWKLMDDERALAVLAYGYGLLQDAFDGHLVGWTGAMLLLLVAFGKILTTSLTIGTGGSGGVFGPSMVIGGGIGGAVGLIAHQYGFVDHPSAFVVVGMSGFFAGAACTPISTIIMVSEITGSYELLMPAMWVGAITFILTSKWSIYDKQEKNRAFSPAHKGEFTSPLLQGMRVSDVMEEGRGFLTVSVGTKLKDIVQLVSKTHADYFPVLDDEGHLVGIFSAHDVREQLYDDTLHELAVAADIMTPDPITVFPDEDLHVALEKFNMKNIDELPVVSRDDPRKLIGMLRRRAITRAYDLKLQELKAELEDAAA